jgi:hypothetical protein
MMTPKSPKLLPWLAKKAGISPHRADILWQDACRYAAHRTEVDSPAYYKLSIDRLLELVAAESLREDAASLGWRPWIRAQNRLWGATLQVVEGASLLANRSWRALSLSARV